MPSEDFETDEEKKPAQQSVLFEHYFSIIESSVI